MKIDRPFLKYNNIIEITPDLYKILNHKVKTYEKPGNLVKLTLGNFTIIKNLISNDDRYKFLYSKIVFDSFCEINIFTKNKEFKRDKDSYIAVLRMIDFENSTQVFRMHRDDFYKIIDFIMSDEEDFYNRLKDGKITLVDDLVNQCSFKLVSFCSKICKFLN